MDIENRLAVAKGEGVGQVGEGVGQVEEGWSGKLGVVDVSFYIQNGQTVRPYCIAQVTKFNPMIDHNGKEYF